MPSFYQKTIKREIQFKGVGLHNGKKVNMKLVPAAPNHGIVFKRTDLKTKNLIPAILIMLAIQFSVQAFKMSLELLSQ